MPNTQRLTGFIIAALLLLVTIHKVAALDASNHRMAIISPPQAGQANGKMRFPENNPATLESKAQDGVMVKQLIYNEEMATVHLKSNTKVTLTDDASLRLEWGSLHLTADSSASVKIQNLTITFGEESSVVAYVSGDQTQIIIKSYGSSITVTYPKTKQMAVLSQGQGTNLEMSTGQLLAPYPVDTKQVNAWWELQAYTYPYTKLPFAHAGPNQEVPNNMAVHLTSDFSTITTGDTLEWTIVSGPTDTLLFDAADIKHPTFTPQEEGIYVIGFQIKSKQGESNVDTVAVSVGLQYLKPVQLFDVPADHPYNKAIVYLNKKGVLNGVRNPSSGEMMLLPERTINRAEYLKLLYQNLNREVPNVEKLSRSPFSDVQLQDWFAPYAVKGYLDGILKSEAFSPAESVNYASALAMYTRALDLELPQREEGDLWYSAYLTFGKQWKIFPEKQAGDILTRAEVAQMMLIIDTNDVRQKRTKLSGTVLLRKSRAPLSKSNILIYTAVQEAPPSADLPPTWKKSDLLYTLQSNETGAFEITLPEKKYYYLEAISKDQRTSNGLITQPKSGIILEVEE